MPDSPTSEVQHVVSGPGLEALGLAHRVRLPSGEGPHPTLFMIHGMDGNEDVTWVFARALGPEWLIITPRAPLPANNGYSWYTFQPDKLPDQAPFDAAQSILGRFIKLALQYYHSETTRPVLLGFSMGAVMAGSYALSHTDQLAGVAILNGFVNRLPEITEPSLNGFPVLILHGTRDEVVPVSMAHTTRDKLIAAGASVTYEESDVGHKLSAQGLRTLTNWLEQRK